MSSRIVERLIDGNRRFLGTEQNPGDFSPALRRETAENGQQPHSIVICCSRAFSRSNEGLSIISFMSFSGNPSSRKSRTCCSLSSAVSSYSLYPDSVFRVAGRSPIRS